MYVISATSPDMFRACGRPNHLVKEELVLFLAEGLEHSGS